MTKPQRRDYRSRRGASLLASALLLAFGAGHVAATGYYGPTEYLPDAANLAQTPEFYWDMELQRLAKDFHAKEKLSLVPRTLIADDGTVDTAPMQKATADADDADFQGALKSGEIKPPDPAMETQQHSGIRIFLDNTDDKTIAKLPVESPSEFADYDRGAFAFRLGKDHWDDARKAWLALLDRPAAERHYRTVWAAFMLGKLGIKAGDPDAVKWFQKARDFAAQGFADSLGMAADSYGWEGRAEWKLGHPEKAAPLFLTQLALGDTSAVVSLKALIPDRDDVDGMLNYGDAAPASQTDAEIKAADEKTLAALKVMAADPLLRRIETAHVLATESGGMDLTGDERTASTRSDRWLAVVQSAKLGAVEDAEYLGWIAYTSGNYKAAQHWLDLAKTGSPVGDWLRARLQLRAGKTADAATSMAKAWQVLRDPVAYTGSNAAQGQDSIFIYGREDGEMSLDQWISGDMGAVHLLRSDFVQALDTFLKGGLRNDAAFVAERVLTANELKAYVDKMPIAPPASAANPNSNGKEDDATWLRYLLGRRLVREDRYADAAPYLPAAYAKLLGNYAAALKAGADSSLPKAKRADAWSTAAWVARYDGMELMGTEVSPDGFESEGDFQDADLAAERITGKYSAYQDGSPINRPMPFPPAKTEVARLQQNQIKPDIRYHYRIIAAGLAVRAAGLMEDNTEELADALNTAGLWVKDRDEKLGDRYYELIEKRCAKTKIGQTVIAKHWFVDQPGPWSDALKSASDALHTQLGIQDPG